MRGVPCLFWVEVGTSRGDVVAVDAEGVFVAETKFLLAFEEADVAGEHIGVVCSAEAEGVDVGNYPSFTGGGLLLCVLGERLGNNRHLTLAGRPMLGKSLLANNYVATRAYNGYASSQVFGVALGLGAFAHTHIASSLVVLDDWVLVNNEADNLGQGLGVLVVVGLLKSVHQFKVISLWDFVADFLHNIHHLTESGDEVAGLGVFLGRDVCDTGGHRFVSVLVCFFNSCWSLM